MGFVVSINLSRMFSIDFRASRFKQCIGRFGNQTYTRTVVGISVVGSKFRGPTVQVYPLWPHDVRTILKIRSLLALD